MNLKAVLAEALKTVRDTPLHHALEVALARLEAMEAEKRGE